MAILRAAPIAGSASPSEPTNLFINTEVPQHAVDQLASWLHQFAPLLGKTKIHRSMPRLRSITDKTKRYWIACPSATADLFARRVFGLDALSPERAEERDQHVFRIPDLGATDLTRSLFTHFWASRSWSPTTELRKLSATEISALRPFLDIRPWFPTSSPGAVQPGSALPKGIVAVLVQWGLQGSGALLGGANLGCFVHVPRNQLPGFDLLIRLTSELELSGEVLLPRGETCHQRPLTRQHYLVTVEAPTPHSRPLFFHLICEACRLDIEAMNRLREMIQSAAAEARAGAANTLWTMAFEQDYASQPFERHLEFVATRLRRLLVFDPAAAETMVRRLAIRYSRHVRETFGSRLAPDLSRMIVTECQIENSQDNESSAELLPRANEAITQISFLGHALGIVALISVEQGSCGSKSDTSEPEDALSQYSSILRQTLRLRSLGGLLPRSCRPYQRLFLEIFLIDCAGSMPLLKTLFASTQTRDAFFETLGVEVGQGTIGLEPDLKSLGCWIRRLISEAYFDQGSASGRGPRSHPPAATTREDSSSSSAGHSEQGSSNKLRWHHRILDVEFVKRAEMLHKVPTSEGISSRSPSSEGLTAPLEQLLSRWLRVSTVIEAQLIQFSRPWRTSGKAGPETTTVAASIAHLWNTTKDSFWRWLWLHKQWNTPRGVDRTGGRLRREHILDLLAGRVPTSHPSSEVSLHIDSLWLNMYLVWSILHRISPGRELQQPALHFPDDYLALRFLANLADVTAYVLWSLIQHERNPRAFAFRDRFTGEVNTQAADTETALVDRVMPIDVDRYTEALIDLVDVYAHHVLELPFEVQVSRFLRWALDHQAILYTLKEHYRDHLYHVIDVFLLGDFLLRCRMDRGAQFVRGYFEDRMVSSWRTRSEGDASLADAGSQPDLLQCWCVAGLFHDIGYWLLTYGALPKALKEFATSSLRPFIDAMSSAMQGRLEELDTHIRDAFGNLVAIDRREGALSEDHGALSSLAVLDHLKEIDWTVGEHLILNRFQPAVEAIAWHNLPHAPISLERSPLAFLLTLCDEVQDWGRQRVVHHELRRDVVYSIASPLNWQVRARPVLTELLLEVKEPCGYEVVLRSEPLSGPWGNASDTDADRAPSPARIDLVQIYRPVADEFLDPLFLWIGKAMNLERLRARGEALDLRLICVTPVSEAARRVGLTNLELLSRVAERVPMLNLRRFVHTIHDLGTRAGLAAAKLGPNASALGSGLVASLHGDRTVDVVFFDTRELAERHPLRGFSPASGFAQLRAAKQEILREFEKRHEFQGRIFSALDAVEELNDDG